MSIKKNQKNVNTILASQLIAFDRMQCELEEKIQHLKNMHWREVEGICCKHCSKLEGCKVVDSSPHWSIMFDFCSKFDLCEIF